MTKQIGYPDYLGSDNNTKLENDYSEVNIPKDLRFVFIHFVDFSSIDSILLTSKMLSNSLK